MSLINKLANWLHNYHSGHWDTRIKGIKLICKTLSTKNVWKGGYLPPGGPTIRWTRQHPVMDHGTDHTPGTGYGMDRPARGQTNRYENITFPQLR